MTRESAYRGAGVRPVLEQACQEHELLLLVTPYLRFESAFLALEPDAVQVRATMTAEEATYGLRSEDLRFRFPHAGRFLEARTRLLGFGLLEGRRTLRLALPAELRDEDQRAAYRVERVGRVEVTYSTPRFQLRSALRLVDENAGGETDLVRLVGGDLHEPAHFLEIARSGDHDERADSWNLRHTPYVVADPLLVEFERFRVVGRQQHRLHAAASKLLAEVVFGVRFRVRQHCRRSPCCMS